MYISNESDAHDELMSYSQVTYETLETSDIHSECTMHLLCAIQIQSNINNNEVPLALPQLSRTRPTSISHGIYRENGS